MIKIIFPTKIAFFPTKYRFPYMFTIPQKVHFSPRNLYSFPHTLMFASLGACSDLELWISDVHGNGTEN